MTTATATAEIPLPFFSVIATPAGTTDIVVAELIEDEPKRQRPDLVGALRRLVGIDRDIEDLGFLPQV